MARLSAVDDGGMKHLVVGVDGREPSLAALRWAVSAAGRGGAVHALAATSPTPDLDAHSSARSDARTALGEALRRDWVAPFDGAVAQLTSSTSDEPAPDALRKAAERRDADAVVIGAHVSPRGIPKMTGGTIRELLATLTRPLIVVPSTASADRTGHAPVIVGIGHGSATDAAVCWAAHHAEATGRPLGLVRVTGDVPLFRIDGLLDVMALYLEPEKRSEWTEEDLADWAERAHEQATAPIDVTTGAVAGLPAVQLVEASESAEVLVIGQHRHGVLGDHHVPQPLRYALTHARCPVVVVPDTHADEVAARS